MIDRNSEQVTDLHVEAFEGQGPIPVDLANIISKVLLRIPGIGTVGIAQEKARP